MSSTTNVSREKIMILSLDIDTTENFIENDIIDEDFFISLMINSTLHCNCNVTILLEKLSNDIPSVVEEMTFEVPC